MLLIMPSVSANGIEIEYEVGGTGPPLLMVMGLGGQLTDWPQQLVDRLHEHFTVITFDNRDAGLSTAFAEFHPRRSDFVKAAIWPSLADLPYNLADMATDAASLLQRLGIKRAHVLGMSMGGMIAQRLAIDHPDRVQTLTSIMSTTGSRFSGRPTFAVMRKLATRGEPARSDALETMMSFFRLVGGPDWDPDDQRTRTAHSLDRAYNPGGVLRQALAIAASRDRTKALSKLELPVLVMHGLDDNLVRPSGGRATAAAITDSRLILFPHMGHDLSATRHAEMVQEIRQLTAALAGH